MFDRESAEKVDTRLQDLLFIMAVSNSCVNPLVYGSYAMNFKRECRYCCRCFWPQEQNLNRKSIGKFSIIINIFYNFKFGLKNESVL